MTFYIGMYAPKSKAGIKYVLLHAQLCFLCHVIMMVVIC